MELNIATKGRAASMDVRRGARQAAHKGDRGGAAAGLPQIGAAGGLPGLAPASVATGIPGQQPTIVLPHSEPLNEAQRATAMPFLEIFGEDVMTCFYS